MAGSFLTQLPDGALGIGTAVLAAFLTSAELPHIRQWVRTKLPRKPIQSAVEFLTRLRVTAGQWLIAQLKLISVTCLLLTAGFFLLRIEYAPLWAMVVSLVDALPILGTGHHSGSLEPHLPGAARHRPCHWPSGHLCSSIPDPLHAGAKICWPSAGA